VEDSVPAANIKVSSTRRVRAGWEHKWSAANFDAISSDEALLRLNVNSKNGRVYLLDEGRTVPFLVHRDADPGTVPTLTRYLNKYANKTGETVSIRYRPVRHIDGRIKRLLIFDCLELDEAA
jgi:hypothetical protein